MARTTRSEETREAEPTRSKKTWQRPNTLPDPEPREGLVHRWIRTSQLGQSDARNVSAKLGEGWEPVPADEYPEFKHFKSESGEHIEVGGLMLCRVEKEVMDQRTQYYDQMASNQMASVDQNYLRESDSRMPMLKPERRSTVKFGGGSRG